MVEGQVDWLELWQELSLRFRQPTRGPRGRMDPWQDRASSFDASVRRRASDGPDPLMESVLGQLRRTDTVVDIGAGTGSWAIPLARVVERVTAIEPSLAMLGVLEENATSAGVTNITVVQGEWQATEVEPHDLALCSHAMYTSPDLVGFVRKMEQVARRTCALVLRVPSHDGIIGQLSSRIYGQWHDSPNFVVAYNVLLGMGVYPNVLMESQVRHWVDDTFEQAVARAKRHLRLAGSDVHDSTVREVLRQGLVSRRGRWVWPDGKRSALVWWSPTEVS